MVEARGVFMIFLMVALIVFLLYMSHQSRDHHYGKLKDEVIKGVRCPPHKWVYHTNEDTDDRGFLLCSQCGQRPKVEERSDDYD